MPLIYVINGQTRRMKWITFDFTYSAEFAVCVMTDRFHVLNAERSE